MKSLSSPFSVLTKNGLNTRRLRLFRIGERKYKVDSRMRNLNCEVLNLRAIEAQWMTCRVRNELWQLAFASQSSSSASHPLRRMINRISPHITL